MVPWMHQLLATLCVASSLALVALGGSGPSSEFHLQTLSFGRPLDSQGACWGYDYHIPCYHSWCDVRGVGEACKLSFSGPLLCLRGPSRFPSLVVTPQGY
jgi:hypothetical protein